MEKAQSLLVPNPTLCRRLLPQGARGDCRPTQLHEMDGLLLVCKHVGITHLGAFELECSSSEGQEPQGTRASLTRVQTPGRIHGWVTCVRPAS